MNAMTQHRSMWALAFMAAAGLGLIFAGRALARPRIAPQSVPSVLSFNPFDPVRTSVPAGVPAGFVGPLASPAPTPGSVPGPDVTSGGATDSGSTGAPPPSLRRPPLRDPFRPPTRSPVAPIEGGGSSVN